MLDFSTIFNKGDNFVISFCISAYQSPSEKGFTLKGKNMLLRAGLDIFSGIHSSCRASGLKMLLALKFDLVLTFSTVK